MVLLEILDQGYSLCFGLVVREKGSLRGKHSSFAIFRTKICKKNTFFSSSDGDILASTVATALRTDYRHGKLKLLTPNICSYRKIIAHQCTSLRVMAYFVNVAAKTNSIKGDVIKGNSHNELVMM
jgi:hypothetical protein